MMRRDLLACALSVVLAVLPQVLLAGTPVLQPFGPDSWQALLASHKGKPLIVHFWSETCSPCVAELPQWGKFLAENPAAPVVLIDWDKPSEDKRRVAGLLVKAGLANADNWSLGDDFEEKIRFKIDRDWMGELPHTILIAPGGMVSAYSGATDYTKLAH